MRGAKRIDLKKIADKALDICAKNGFQVLGVRRLASISALCLAEVTWYCKMCSCSAA
jgi:hypothetical protein